jgi:hypothetical protein
MALGQLRGPSRKTGAPPNCPNQMAIVALGGLEVCDGGHWLVVMKKSRGPSVRGGEMGSPGPSSFFENSGNRYGHRALIKPLLYGPANPLRHERLIRAVQFFRY